MNARDVIENIKLLSPEDRAVVVNFVKGMTASLGDQNKLEATAKKIFDRYDDLFRKLAS